MQLGVDGTKIPGEVQFEVDTGDVVVLFSMPVDQEDVVVKMVQRGFEEARLAERL